MAMASHKTTVSTRVRCGTDAEEVVAEVCSALAASDSVDGVVAGAAEAWLARRRSVGGASSMAEDEEAWDGDDELRGALAVVAVCVVADGKDGASVAALVASDGGVVGWVSRVYSAMAAVAGHGLDVVVQALLTGAVMATCGVLKIGVSDDAMVAEKKHAELIEPVDVRIAATRTACLRIHPGLEYSVFPIHDMWGPTRDDPELDAMVVSAETVAGGYAIRKARNERGLTPEIDVVVVDLVQPADAGGNDVSTKVSSSALRAAEAVRQA
ncbi:bifunctional coenzyme A synthase [Thecamonas trahens ATCC 50062]|uniref:Bifunctional coenzyme A synthase n=1 Tax=Thecamonas trahens ATCC 50062 TaxID=461836 RepID=A0A0L0DKN8_THETB|nr:bifunctional coenzyme A synthase [Thecamonas trahens ATCC 50062]KNC52800.1 bifunctional coenzyme A synthase [Thecamonas trahens ATCC 50062]|eukprot:XP_013755109.1 bifunctional coenzyme A synthase [Thecamonas trahens ATCC 50062]